MFFTREKNDTSNQKSQRCEFRAKISAFDRRLQLAAPSLCRHSTRKVFLEEFFWSFYARKEKSISEMGVE